MRKEDQIVKTVVTDKFVAGRRIIHEYIIPNKPVTVADLGPVLLKLVLAAQNDKVQ